MMAAKIKKGDNVFVTVGNDKGKSGIVKKIFSVTNRAIVEGINVSRRFKKNQGVEDSLSSHIERTIHISNLALHRSSTSESSRVGFAIREDGEKVRIFRKSGEFVDV
jgi:large subunit ribosomal protein L24